MHPRLLKQLFRAGINVEECDPRWKSFLEDVDRSYSGEESADPAIGNSGADVEMLQAMLNSIPGYVSWVSYDLHYLGVNAGLAQAFGMDPAEFVGRPIGFNNPDTPFVKFIASFFASNSQFEQCVTPLPFSKEDGVRWYYLIGRKYNNGRAAVVLGFDVTQIRRNEDTIARQETQLAASAKLAELGQLAAIIAHEVNNPLGVILGNSQILRRTLDREPIDLAKAHDVAQRIEMTAVRIAKIIRGCKSFSREGSGDPMQSAKLGLILDESLEMVKPHYASKGVKLIHPPLEDGPRIRCRPTQISQIIVNLLNNAIDAVEGRRERWVRIDMGQTEDWADLRVTDSGPGIPPDIAQKIFHPFFTTKGASKGTGLGLSICAGIVRDHGGEIKVDHDDKNTCFRVRLPREGREVSDAS